MKTGFDLFHSNTVEIVPRDIAVARKGNLLICVRYRDLVAIVDEETRKVVWRWGPGVLDWPHNPSVLANGNILIFDNGTRRGYSRLVEVNPATGEIVWQYVGDPPESFYSNGRGAAQELPGGNILVTESGEGHVFEITRKGEIVWEFRNDRCKTEKRRNSIYRMVRFTPQALDLVTLHETFRRRLEALGYVKDSDDRPDPEPQ